jgi:gamma-butyrobetaine dioxygenase
MTVFDEIFILFRDKGSSAYFGESVSQLEHALQAAWFAQNEHAPAHLVAAALLHDVGHLLSDMPEDVADHGVDAKHEEIGESWLCKRFGPEVFEPVRLHVTAKRYLCVSDPAYAAMLSPASVQSLHLQGGLMTADEIAAFEKNAFYRDAVRLRMWDDKAKTVNLETPDLSSYRELINSL